MSLQQVCNIWLEDTLPRLRGAKVVYMDLATWLIIYAHCSFYMTAVTPQDPDSPALCWDLWLKPNKHTRGERTSPAPVGISRHRLLEVLRVIAVHGDDLVCSYQVLNALICVIDDMESWRRDFLQAGRARPARDKILCALRGALFVADMVYGREGLAGEVPGGSLETYHASFIRDSIVSDPDTLVNLEYAAPETAIDTLTVAVHKLNTGTYIRQNVRWVTSTGCPHLHAAPPDLRLPEMFVAEHLQLCAKLMRDMRYTVAPVAGTENRALTVDLTRLELAHLLQAMLTSVPPHVPPVQMVDVPPPPVEPQTAISVLQHKRVISL